VKLRLSLVALGVVAVAAGVWLWPQPRASERPRLPGRIYGWSYTSLRPRRIRPHSPFLYLGDQGLIVPASGPSAGTIRWVAASPDGRSLMATQQSAFVIVWSLDRTGYHTLTLPGADPANLSWAGNDRVVHWDPRTEEVRGWRLEEGGLVELPARELPGWWRGIGAPDGTRPVRRALSPDLRRAIVVTQAAVWLITGTVSELAPRRLALPPCLTAEWLSPERWWCLQRDRGIVTLLDRDGHPVRSTDLRGSIPTVTVSPDGEYAAFHPGMRWTLRGWRPVPLQVARLSDGKRWELGFDALTPVVWLP